MFLLLLLLFLLLLLLLLLLVLLRLLLLPPLEDPFVATVVPVATDWLQIGYSLFAAAN